MGWTNLVHRYQCFSPKGSNRIDASRFSVGRSVYGIRRVFEENKVVFSQVKSTWLRSACCADLGELIDNFILRSLLE